MKVLPAKAHTPPYCEMMQPEEKSNFILFVNTKSGGQHGRKVLGAVQACGLRVCDLGAKTAEEWLAEIETEYGKELRVLIAGGDGSVGWILSALHATGLDATTSVGVIPLGTGNDFSRICGWGGHYKNQLDNASRINKTLSQYAQSTSRLFDRWLVEFSRTSIPEKSSINAHSTTKSMINYFSVGLDAKIALKFHQSRTRHPHLFKSTLFNQAVYGWHGCMHLASRKPKLSQIFTLKVDEQEIEIAGNVMALVVLNINSYAGGVKLWTNNTKIRGFEPSAFDDGKLEVVAFTSGFQLGCATIKAIRPARVAQGSVIQIIAKKIPEPPVVAYQIDGEPWSEIPLTVTLARLETQASVLVKHTPKK
eukprot:c14956_g1_i1.p1 GENE.c14956_g1_i1~~c14956_g1_i1.p1  ORF type:complete len:364 (-),score=92.68 c14956_g1_i1:84-1175(-)